MPELGLLSFQEMDAKSSHDSKDSVNSQACVAAISFYDKGMHTWTTGQITTASLLPFI